MLWIANVTARHRKFIAGPPAVASRQLTILLRYADRSPAAQLPLTMQVSYLRPGSTGSFFTDSGRTGLAMAQWR